MKLGMYIQNKDQNTARMWTVVIPVKKPTSRGE